MSSCTCGKRATPRPLRTHDIKEDRWDRWFFNHGRVGPLVGTIALCALIGVGWGLLAAGLHALTYVFFLSSSINGLCHTRGYRTFDNTATNIRWLALITGGEGFHNNHHGCPRSPKFSARPGEIDPSWPIIQLLTRMRLARAHQSAGDGHGVPGEPRYEVPT
jgi:fatty-acid desaturase